MAEPNKECEHHHLDRKSNWYRIGTWGAVLIMAYFLITEHQAHVIQFAPYLLLLACPFMHLFMHHGHDHNRHEDQPQETSKERK